jgi:hypothetical protein
MDAIVNTGKIIRATTNEEIFFKKHASTLGSRLLLLFLLVTSFSIPTRAGLCPQGCQCENRGLFTVCPTGELKHIPHFLNPAIKQLKINGNRITKLEGALSFYDKVRNNLSCRILAEY